MLSQKKLAADLKEFEKIFSNSIEHQTPSITREWFERQEKIIKKFKTQEFCQKRNGIILVPEVITNPKTNKKIKVVNIKQLNITNIPEKEKITRTFLQGNKEYVKLSFLKKEKLI